MTKSCYGVIFDGLCEKYNKSPAEMLDLIIKDVKKGNDQFGDEVCYPELKDDGMPCHNIDTIIRYYIAIGGGAYIDTAPQVLTPAERRDITAWVLSADLKPSYNGGPFLMFSPCLMLDEEQELKDFYLAKEALDTHRVLWGEGCNTSDLMDIMDRVKLLADGGICKRS